MKIENMLQRLSVSPSYLNLLALTLSLRKSLSYRNQSINLLYKAMDSFPYDKDLRYERVKRDVKETF